MKRVRPDQIGRIVSLLENGQVTEDEADAFIRKHESRVQPALDADVVQAQQFALWEIAFPIKTNELFAIVKPFFDWEMRFQPVPDDGLKRLKNAVFWRKVRDVRYYRIEDYSSMKMFLRVSLASSLSQISTAMVHPLFQKAIAPRTRVENAFHAQAIVYELQGIVLAAYGHEVANKPKQARKFDPLLTLFREGIVPMGFDDTGVLLAFVHVDSAG